MQGVYFSISHVPFSAPQSEYPGLKLYVTEMKKYEPNYLDDELALQGWESAALFVQGVKMAGNDLTWANVVKADNSLTSFTAGGLRSPTNWKDAGHSGHAPALLRRLHQGVGRQIRPGVEQGEQRLRVLRLHRSDQEPDVPAARGDTDAILSRREFSRHSHDAAVCIARQAWRHHFECYEAVVPYRACRVKGPSRSFPHHLTTA